MEVLALDKIEVLSLFDGCSGAMLALKKAKIPVSEYHAFEIDKYAIKVSKSNFPEIKHYGDVRKASTMFKEGDFDLLIGGSPCQDLSIAGKRKGLEGERSGLFREYVKCLEAYKPKYFLFENVASMSTKNKAIISKALMVKPIMINSALVTAQNRKRLYWTNIPGIEQPEDRGILLKDVVFKDVYPFAIHNLYGGFGEKSVRVFTEKSPTIRTSSGGGHIPSLVKMSLLHSQTAIDYMNKTVRGGRTHWDFGHHSDIRDDKSSAVVANFFKGVPYNVFKDWNCIRSFHPIECMRLQKLPDNFCDGVSKTQQLKMIGNGFTIPVIAHILKRIK